MASDAMILLPGEIIVYILEDKGLSFTDIVNFSRTCKSLYEIVNDSNKLWKTKFFQRWPLLKEAYQTSKESMDQRINWKGEVKASVNSRRKLFHLLSSMSSKHYRKQELTNSEFKEFDPLFRPEEGAHPLAYYYLVDELISLIESPAITSNLTHRYYALKIVRYLKQCHLKNEWHKFISLPEKQQTLERGATIIAQWSQPEMRVSYLAISASLDNIAEQTKEILKEEHPEHSIFSFPEERLNFWKDNIIDDNQWTVSESKLITDALRKALFVELCFHGTNELCHSPHSLFIDRVLEKKRGIPITLAIVFESVARRLGIRCEPVSLPSHFLLRWKETYGWDAKDKENFYIDVFHGGEFLTKKSCPRIGGVSKCPIEKYNVHEPATAVEVVNRMAGNLEIAVRQHDATSGRTARIRSAFELRYMIQPNDANVLMQLGRIYKLHRMDLTELVNILENMQKNMDLMSRGQANVVSRTFQTLQKWQKNAQPDDEVEPKRRVPGVKYAVGLIMKHKIHGNMCVIIGWDARCMATTEWMNDINLNELDEGADQPFYNVLAEFGSCHYVAQENLLLAVNPVRIYHDAFGRYFCKFNGTHYVPNEEKAKEYPEDEKIRNELLATYVQNKTAR